MRKYLLPLCIALLPGFISCSVNENCSPEIAAIRFRGVMESTNMSPETKTYADMNYRIYWNEFDHVSIFSKKTYNREYEFLGSTGDTAGEFEPYGSDPSFFTEVDIETGYNYSVYPYQRRNACDYDGTLLVPFPTEQYYVEGSSGIGVNLFMVARAKDGDLSYKHIAGYVGFKFYGDNVSVASVSVKSNNGEPLTGRPLVVFSDDGIPYVSFGNTPGTSDKVTLICDPPVQLNASETEYKTFWIALPPSVLAKGFTYTVTDTNGGTFSRSGTSSYVVERKVFKTVKAREVVTEGGTDIPEVIHVESIQLDAEEMELEVGETGTLSATVLPANADDKSYSWSSSNEAVATVDANGKVTAVAVGVAVITATTTDGAKAASCTVTVKEQPVVVTYSLAISPAEASIQVGGSQAYTVTLTTVTNGESAESTVADAVLTVSDATVASVSGLVVTGTKQGTVTVTAKYTPEGSAEELSATAQLTVNKDANHAGDPVEIEEGDEF